MTACGRLAVAAVLLWVLPASAAPSPGPRCTAAKTKATAKKTTAKLRCFGAATAKSSPVDDACLTKAERKFNEAWTRIEADGGCLLMGDGGSIERKVDTYVDDVVRMLEPCGEVSGICGGGCPDGQSCFSSTGCFGESIPCACYSDFTVTTCTTMASTTSTSTTTSSSCPTYPTTTLGLPDCGGSGGPCFGGCANARECVPDSVSGVCGCTGPLRPCGFQDFAGHCGGECPTGETCLLYSPIQNGCPSTPQCGCVASP